MAEVTLEQMLDAREARVRMQDELRRRYGAPVVSFTMNIPGPVKDTPLIRHAFGEGLDALRAALSDAALPVLWSGVKRENTGCEALFAIDGDALSVKRVCTAIEDADALGRLYDMDVLAPDGTKLDRETVGGRARNCIVCGAPGRGCASRRTHMVEELQAATRRIMEAHFAEIEARHIAELVTRALLDEVYTTPKPGLVDRNNNGSHADMTVETFERSADALRGYWARCFTRGFETRDAAPEESFVRLREAGVEAERAMFAATLGVNTHKGAVYALGVLCGAIGRLWRPDTPREIDAVLRECAAMTKAAVDAQFSALAANPETAATKGQRLYLSQGMRGIRGEVADGLPGIAETSLPKLRGARRGVQRQRRGRVRAARPHRAGRRHEHGCPRRRRGGVEGGKRRGKAARGVGVPATGRRACHGRGVHPRQPLARRLRRPAGGDVFPLRLVVPDAA